MFGRQLFGSPTLHSLVPERRRLKRDIRPVRGVLSGAARPVCGLSPCDGAEDASARGALQRYGESRLLKQLLLLTLVGALGVLSRAGWAAPLGPDSSWSEIRSTPSILIRAPMIWFGADALSVLDICRSGDELRGQTSAGVTVEVPLKSAPQSYTIEVDRIVGGLRHIREIPLFTKRFTIPPCNEPGK